MLMLLSVLLLLLLYNLHLRRVSLFGQIAVVCTLSVASPIGESGSCERFLVGSERRLGGCVFDPFRA